MSWFAVDDRFPNHRKVLSLRRSPRYAQALALWTLAGAWACGQELEQHTGRVPVDVVASFGIPDWQEALDALVLVDLWSSDGEVVTFHDWDHWNGPEARHNRSREQTRQRQHAKRLRDCLAGQHSKNCPTKDLEDQPHTCPRRAGKGASRDAERQEKAPRHGASRDAGTGRDGTGTGSTMGTVAALPTSQDDNPEKGSAKGSSPVWPDWPEVPEHLRTPAHLRPAAGGA